MLNDAMNKICPNCGHSKAIKQINPDNPFLYICCGCSVTFN